MAGKFLAAPLIIVYALFSRLTATPGVSLYLILLLWMLGNTAVMNMYVDYANMMPSLATTTYPTFVFLRRYSFFGFLFLSIVVYNYARSGSPQKLLDLIAILGVLVTAYAIYVLIAQRLSLPMLPKTRFGTGEGGPSPVARVAILATLTSNTCSGPSARSASRPFSASGWSCPSSSASPPPAASCSTGAPSSSASASCRPAA